MQRRLCQQFKPEPFHVVIVRGSVCYCGWFIVLLWLFQCVTVVVPVCVTVWVAVCVTVWFTVCITVWVAVCVAVCVTVWVAVCVAVCVTVWVAVCVAVWVAVYCVDKEVQLVLQLEEACRINMASIPMHA